MALKGSPRRTRRRRGIIIALIVIFLLTATSVARFYTDFLWFQEVGLESVLWKGIGTQLLLGIIVGGLVASVLWLNLFLVSKIAPSYQIPRFEVVGREDPLERYRESLLPYARWMRLGISLFVGLLAGFGASASWRTFLLWVNRVSFGRTDPQFNKDIGFYFFELPFFDNILSWLWFALIASLLLVIAAHFLYGSIRPDAGWSGVASGALAHISVLLGLLALVKAASYYLGRYQLNFSSRGAVTGASYTDVNAQLLALNLLIIISIISAVLFLVNIRVRRLILPAAAVGVWLLVVVLAGGVFPWWVQRFSVAPQEPVREAPFIERNIAATQEAFGITDVRSTTYAANATLDGEDIANNDAVLQNVRLWDPGVLKLAYSQLQALQPYYHFDDVDIDRYEVGGEMRQVLLSPRELLLDDIPAESQTWSNLHLQFTHGYGLVASLANETSTAGQPDFIVKNVPGEVDEEASALDVEQPGLYFGEAFTPSEYSVVNSAQEELDFPTASGPERTQYEGQGGINIGSPLRKFAFAVREGDPNLVLSSLIESESRILIYRNVRDRVLRAAPFLSLDSDPYLAAVDGRLVWIIDAYTSSPWYPYGQRFDLDQIVGSVEEGALSGSVNYIRNSVKVVVDAYEGTMDFHIVDDEDPLIQAWSKAFPDLFNAEEPSEDLQAHFRYPEDLFKVQSEVYLTYHITDPQDFYAKDDAWSIPRNAFHEGSQAVEVETLVQPKYLLFQLPEETEQEFVLTQPFTPRARNNMISMMVARSDPENYGELVNLQFPRSRQIAGPIQIDNLINQDVEISQTLSLLRQRGSNVDFGALVILPLEDSLLYIQPIFVTAEDGGIPELKRVAMVIGEEVAFEVSFEEALKQLFDLEAPAPPETPTPPTDPGPGPGEEPPTTGGQGELERIVDEAGRVYEQAQGALADGDFETYGRLVERLGRLLQRANDLSQ